MINAFKNIKNKTEFNIQTPYENNKINNQTYLQKKKESEELFEIKDKTEAIGQIKNIAQEKDITLKEKNEIKVNENNINSFDDLIELCSLKKEIKLKYELEKNVNLVSFENKRIEISFNDDLDKNFIKDLSEKLYDWTNARWIITLVKLKETFKERGVLI